MENWPHKSEDDSGVQLLEFGEPFVPFHRNKKGEKEMCFLFSFFLNIYTIPTTSAHRIRRIK